MTRWCFRQRWVRLLLIPAMVLAALPGLAGCGPEPDPLAPPEIVYGEDICDQCGMIISDERYAAAAIVVDGGDPASRAFDDIGELFAYAAAHPDIRIQRWYVHDLETLQWLDAQQATFARWPGLITPMGHGLAAFADPARAQAMAAEHGGQTLSFDALRLAAGDSTPSPTKERP